MDKTALFNLSYGLFIIGAKDGGRNVGCIVNTVVQATSQPSTVTVCINKDNYTNGCVKKTGEFAVSILSESAKESTFGTFGFKTSRDTDKFATVPFALTPAGLPYINEGVCGYLECKVLNFVDNFTHTIFVAEVAEAENLFKEPPMTYAYYRGVVKGTSPKNAPTYVDETDKSTAKGGEHKEGYACGVCGYEYPGSAEEFERLGEDYVCPVCGAAKRKFVRRA